MANWLVEVASLGLTFAAGFLIVGPLGDPSTSHGWILLLAATTIGGVLERACVGMERWRAFARKLEIARLAWVGATIAGKLLAWLLSSLPSTLRQVGAVARPSTTIVPSQRLVLFMGPILGLVAGEALVGAQALALRCAVRKPGI